MKKPAPKTQGRIMKGHSETLKHRDGQKTHPGRSNRTGRGGRGGRGRGGRSGNGGNEERKYEKVNEGRIETLSSH